MIRVRLSVPPPGASGTMMRTGLAGYRNAGASAAFAKPADNAE
jgi:hypothetical protein